MKIFLFISVVLCSMLVLSCSPEKMPDSKFKVQQPANITASVTVDKTSLSFDSSSSTETVNITANVEWKPECSDSWVTVNKSNSSQLKVSVTANQSTARTSNIYLKQQGESTILATITISQSGTTVKNEISASVTSLNFAADGGTQNLSITSNFNWDTVERPSWITLSPSSGSSGSHTIALTAEKNNDSQSRIGQVAIGQSSSTIVFISVSQDAQIIDNFSIAMSSTEFSWDTCGDALCYEILYVTAPGQAWVATADQNWVNFNDGSDNSCYWIWYGFGDGQLRIYVDGNFGNRRTATITVRAGTITKTISIVQQGYW